MCSSSTHSTHRSPNDDYLYARTHLVPGKATWVTEGVLQTYKISHDTQTSSTFRHYIFDLRPPLQLARGHFEDEGRVSRDALWAVTCYQECEVGAPPRVMSDKELRIHGIDPIDGASSLSVYQDRIFDVRFVSSCDPTMGEEDVAEEMWEVTTYRKLSYGTCELGEDELIAHKIDPESGCSSLAAYKDYVFLVHKLTVDQSTVCLEEDYCAGKATIYRVTCSKILPQEPGARRRLSDESLLVHRIDLASGRSALPIYSNCKFDVQETNEGAYMVQVRDLVQEQALQVRRDSEQEQALQVRRDSEQEQALQVRRDSEQGQALQVSIYFMQEQDLALIQIMAAKVVELRAIQLRDRELRRATSCVEFSNLPGPGPTIVHSSSCIQTPRGSYQSLGGLRASPSGVRV